MYQTPKKKVLTLTSTQISKRLTEEGDVYVTELREPLSRSPQDKTFFQRLDSQLTKVNKFYKKKEAENIARAGALEKQMLALIIAQERTARQDLPDYGTHMEIHKEAHLSGDHHQSKLNNKFLMTIKIMSA